MVVLTQSPSDSSMVEQDVIVVNRSEKDKLVSRDCSERTKHNKNCHTG